MSEPSITCPICGSTSRNINDVEQGYCGRCQAYTRGATVSEPLNEYPGHTITTLRLEHSSYSLLTCECGWKAAEPNDRANIGRELHWIAMKITDDVIGDAQT